MPIACPRCSIGYASSITDCDSGTSAAPHIPCSSRNATICSIVWDSAQSSDATVKPPTHTMNSFLRPKRSASQPTGAVITAAATMYEVSTQD
jgi:hypothetical protein